MFFLSLIAGLLSCDNSRSADSQVTSQDKTGSILLGINHSCVETRTITPEIEMEVHKYQIAGFGPNDEMFFATVNNEASSSVFFQRDNLTTGDWTIQISAYNSNDQQIAWGTTDVTIIEEEQISSVVTLLPFTGTGNLQLTFTFSESIDIVPAFEVELTSVDSVVQSLSENVTGSGNSFLLSSSDLDAGYYLLNVKIRNSADSAYIGGFMEGVRIVSGQTTEDEIFMSIIDNDENSSGFDISINTDLKNPIKITVNGDDTKLKASSSYEDVYPKFIFKKVINIVLIFQALFDEIDYQSFYINGNRIDAVTGNQINIGSSLGLGTHRLDYVVTVGDVISSKGVYITVVDYTPVKISQVNIQDSEYFWFLGTERPDFYCYITLSGFSGINSSYQNDYAVRVRLYDEEKTEIWDEIVTESVVFEEDTD